MVVLLGAAVFADVTVLDTAAVAIAANIVDALGWAVVMYATNVVAVVMTAAAAGIFSVALEISSVVFASHIRHEETK